MIQTCYKKISCKHEKIFEFHDMEVRIRWTCMAAVNSKGEKSREYNYLLDDYHHLQRITIYKILYIVTNIILYWLVMN